MTPGPQGADDETCRGNAHVAEPNATAESGDQETRRGDVVVPDADPGSVASFITNLAENEDHNYDDFLSECTPGAHYEMTVEGI